MSNETPRREPPRAQKGAAMSAMAGKWKWLAAAGAAVVLIGAGYVAWKSVAGPPTEIAYSDPLPSEYRGDPLESEISGDAFESSLSADAQVAAAEPAASDTAAPRPRRAARATVEPTQVVGVTPAAATTNGVREEEAIVVPGHRRPQWARRPSEYRLSSAYPTRALERGREGEARVRCIVQENGALDCERRSETPGNFGFGAAALRVARMFRHAPRREDGSSAVGTPVNLRVLFRIAEDDGRRRRSS